MPKTGQDIVNLARTFIGKVSYVFGASDPVGGKSDCSGFTQYIYKQNGYIIGRTTHTVWTSDLPEVEKENLQVGDLILFKDTYNSGYKDGVSHIGIYSGNNKFIHCCTRGVVESDLSDTYYKNKYLGAKRVIGFNGAIRSDTSETSSDTSETSSETSLAESIGLKWWGDIVKVVIAALLLIGGISLFVLGVKGTILE